MATKNKINAVILCGGAGTRFYPVTKKLPKVMADIHGKPFLDILIEHYLRQGIARFILCTGYRSDYIKNYYQKSKLADYILYSEEKNPLGTGGAVKNAEPLILSNDFIVLNGDSFCDIDIDPIIHFHSQLPDAYATCVLTPSDERTDTGGVIIDNASSRILSFQEKNNDLKKPYISTGIYVFNKKILEMMPKNQTFSLEYLLFPQLANKGFYGYVANKKLIDIGTPERYKDALDFFHSLKNRIGVYGE